MFVATIATAAIAACASVVSAAPVVARSSAPSTYYEGYLEEYDVYHARYIALDCKSQHNTTFFDDCCHPLLANETLATRPSYCSPNATVSASVASTISDYTETATASASATADVEAEAAYSSASVSVDDAASTASYYLSTDSGSATATATATASVDAAAEWAYQSSGHHRHSSSADAASASATASATSTEEEAYPTTTSSSEEQYTATSTSSSTAAAATTSSSSSDSTTYSGYATFFYQDGVAGECGTVHSDSDLIIAIDANGWWSDYESNDDSPYCGKSITITNTNNGKSVTAVVADVCPTCDTNNSLDLSVGAFTAIASESDGEVPITWVWA